MFTFEAHFLLALFEPAFLRAPPFFEDFLPDFLVFCTLTGAAALDGEADPCAGAAFLMAFDFDTLLTALGLADLVLFLATFAFAIMMIKIWLTDHSMGDGIPLCHSPSNSGLPSH